jgi:hypothetical protein
MKTTTTFTASIYVGMRERYTGEIRSIEMAREALREYVKSGLCVTLTETEYIYTNGSEPGFIVGLINYPRFPASDQIIRTKALEIAQDLLKLFHQGKVSVVFPDVTVMLEAEDDPTNPPCVTPIT